MKKKQRKIKPHKKKAPAITSASITADDLEDLIGEMPSAKAVPAKPITTIDGETTVLPGIYYNEHRNVAIVSKASTRAVQFITMVNGAAVEVTRWSVDRFLHEFIVHAPSYPMRRAARIFLNSFMPKTLDAERALRALLVS